jgi:peroxidase
LFEHFARGDVLYEDYGVDQLLRGLFLEPMQNADSVVTKDLTDRLFEDPARKFSGQDLISINIMRGRDHGLPGYNEFREYCNLTRATDFSDLKTYIPSDVVDSMQKVYRHVDDLDLYLAGVSEYPVYGGVVRLNY